MKKLNLTEATILALEGKLIESADDNEELYSEILKDFNIDNLKDIIIKYLTKYFYTNYIQIASITGRLSCSVSFSMKFKIDKFDRLSIKLGIDEKKSPSLSMGEGGNTIIKAIYRLKNKNIDYNELGNWLYNEFKPYFKEFISIMSTDFDNAEFKYTITDNTDNTEFVNNFESTQESAFICNVRISWKHLTKEI